MDNAGVAACPGSKQENLSGMNQTGVGTQLVLDAERKSNTGSDSVFPDLNLNKIIFFHKLWFHICTW